MKGRKAIGILFRRFTDKDHRHSFPGQPTPTSSREEFAIFHQLYHDELGHYFRNIYQILKFVDQSSIDNKQLYTNLLRAQLSSDELAILFYNCISDFGLRKFKPLIERYAFFEHLPLYDSLSMDDARSYAPGAFGDSEEWAQALAEVQQQET